MLKRVLSAAVMIPLALAVVFAAPPWLFAAITTALAALAYFEFVELGQRLFPAGDRWLVIALGAAGGMAMVYPWAPGNKTAVLIGYFFALACLGVVRARKVEELFPRVFWPAAGFLYIYFFFSFIFNIRFDLPGGKGEWLLLFFLLIQWAGDTLAYVCGKAFGRHKLAPMISPGKTIEGTFGGLIGSTLIGVALALFFFPAKPWLPFALMGLCLGGFGQIGDLLESLIKRACGVKDSSNLIPGHGGVLDRLDSVIFTAPLYYLWIDRLIR